MRSLTIWRLDSASSSAGTHSFLPPDDAAEAIACGADAVMVSNHGGHNLDSCIPPLWALPDIAARVAGNAEVFMDGGITPT